MALTQNGDYWYGDTIDDLQSELVNYSKSHRYEAVKFAEAICTCGGRIFNLRTDEEEGVAERVCLACRASHFMGDSKDYLAEATVEGHSCVCESEEFRILSGVALYRESNDVRWYYIGCQCTKCNLVGVFADWKCEGGHSTSFLAST